MKRLALILALLAASTAFAMPDPRGAAILDPNTLTLRTDLCPSEDSCRADWYDGAWHLIAVTP